MWLGDDFGSLVFGVIYLWMLFIISKSFDRMLDVGDGMLF